MITYYLNKIEKVLRNTDFVGLFLDLLIIDKILIDKLRKRRNRLTS